MDAQPNPSSPNVATLDPLGGSLTPPHPTPPSSCRIYAPPSLCIDSGSTKVYVWFGCGEITKDECELAIRIGIRYSRKAPEMSMYQDDGPDEIKKQMAQVGLKGVAKVNIQSKFIDT